MSRRARSCRVRNVPDPCCLVGLNRYKSLGNKRVEAKGIVFDGVADALRVPNTDIRLFGKPESFIKRRMGVALAFDADVEVARVNAKKAAGMVKPRSV